ncbi:hypothetical protein RC88_04670 [Pectobacterium parvum]|nr:hypothetical protein RC88_04670 [Pectobacterium parvum]GKW40572.1 hypothetical protein PEC301879_04310 [Pectobacterium carotovorum subsp. carotovorum]
MKVTLEELQAFVAVIDSGSISAAAEQLGQTMSSIRWEPFGLGIYSVCHCAAGAGGRRRYRNTYNVLIMC